MAFVSDSIIGSCKWKLVAVGFRPRNTVGDAGQINYPPLWGVEQRKKGVAGSADENGTSPPMGNGHFPDGNNRQAF